MSTKAEWRTFSWEELRALHYLWKCQRTLTCEGTTWSMYGKFRLVLGRSTVESLYRRGCIKPVGKYVDPSHDDFELTPFGQHWAEITEPDYQTQLDRRIEEEIEAKGRRPNKAPADG